MKQPFFLLFFLLLIPLTLADSSSWWDVIWHVGDKIPPVTTTDYNGACIDFNLQITLTCTDTGGSGCAWTYRRVDYGDWEYVGGGTPWTFNIISDSNVMLEYYSIDTFNNVEIVKFLEICFISHPRTTERYIAAYDQRIIDSHRYLMQSDVRQTDSNRFYQSKDARASHYFIQDTNTRQAITVISNKDEQPIILYLEIAIVIIAVVVVWKIL